MTVGDEVRPVLVAHPDTASGTGLILFPRADSLPAVWVGPVSGAALTEIGLAIPAQRALTALVILIEAN